jgi:4-amino-4-deoxy-L-arabinose transferase-like glycosyltransferase
VGVAHAALLLLERRLRVVVVAGGVLALAIGVAAASPWYVAMERVQPGYLHYYFVERHLFGFATGTQRHGNRPFLYYVPVLLAGGLPWILTAAFAWRRLRPASMPPLTPEQADASRLGWTWLVSGWLFLSLAGSKLFTYALPLFPAIALLATVGWLSRGASRSAAFDWVVVVQAGICALVLPLALAAVPLAMPVQLPAWTWVAALGTLAGWAWLARAWRRGDERRALTLAPALGAVTVVTLLAGVMPRVGEVMSAKDLAAMLNREPHLPPEVWVLRQRLGSVVFYLEPALRAEATPERIVQVQLPHLRGRAVPAGTLVAVSSQDHAKIAAFVARGAAFREAGRYRLYRAEDLGVPVR